MCTTTKERRPLLLRQPPPSAFSRPYSRPMFSPDSPNSKSKRTNLRFSFKLTLLSLSGALLILSSLISIQKYPILSSHLRAEETIDTSIEIHPFYKIWPSQILPYWATKSPPSTLYAPPYTIPASKQVCLIHVGKTAGSSIGCKLGFNLHCDPNTRTVAPGLLTRYTMHMFHTNIYDCPSNTSYYLFVLRNPLERIKSAFLYDKPLDWGNFRTQMGEKYYWGRKRLYQDCEFDTLEEMAQRGLLGKSYKSKEPSSAECGRRARDGLTGKEHYGCHFYFNYQYHYEGILPLEDKKIVTIRTEHIVDDWNGVEVELGGRRVIKPNIMGEKNNVNTHVGENDKFLSDESKKEICNLLCNDIQVYKSILRQSVNLNEEDVSTSIAELKQSCPTEAEATTCPTPMPDIQQKLLESRGYYGQTSSYSPYERHWANKWTLPRTMTKDYSKYLYMTSSKQEVCFVNVVSYGAGGAVGCALGFNLLECGDGQDRVAPGLLPQYTTKQFLCGIYDCFDDSAYYLMGVKNPVERFVEAFYFDLPRDWEEFRAQEGEKRYNFRKELFLDCPFGSVEELIRLGVGQESFNATVSKECRERALGAIDGTGHYGKQLFYNYQYYVEGLPKNAKVMVIREEYMVDDWNSAEAMVGGVTDILGDDQTTLLNADGDEVSEKLSDGSRTLLCEKLCNEIQVYKKILEVAMNLTPNQKEQSLKELKVSCPKEAAAESCQSTLPDITSKLYLSRGYDEDLRLDPRPTNEISIGRPIHPKPPSPYEIIWPSLKLPYYMKKDRQYAIESVPANKRTCFVHVGKTAGSTVGCAIGFNLHCDEKNDAPPGLFPQYTTHMFHSQMYDCHDDSAYFVFVVRNPLDRMISAFNYDNPSKDWEKFRLEMGEKHYQLRKRLYMDCPFETFDELAQKGLAVGGNASEECRRRAGAAIEGTEHFGCHFFFNYQYHLEAIPKNATIMTIRTEHLVDDWNSVEYKLGGEKEVLGPNQTVLAHNNVNSASGDKLKYLSDESKVLICEKLCNEIQMYKRILRNSINLSEEQVNESIEEMKDSCPKEAVAETCLDPLPDIMDKLVSSRGYKK